MYHGEKRRSKYDVFGKIDIQPAARRGEGREKEHV